METFLRALVTASGAERAAVLRLGPDEGFWVVEASIGEERSRGPDRGERTRATGHPLTWCLREDLLVQLRAEELVPGIEGGGWALAGPVPGSPRVLVVTYRSGPPIRAREALGAAVAHLGSLAEAGALGISEGEREPLSGSAGRA